MGSNALLDTLHVEKTQANDQDSSIRETERKSEKKECHQMNTFEATRFTQVIHPPDSDQLISRVSPCDVPNFSDGSVPSAYDIEIDHPQCQVEGG